MKTPQQVRDELIAAAKNAKDPDALYAVEQDMNAFVAAGKRLRYDEDLDRYPGEGGRIVEKLDEAIVALVKMYRERSGYSEALGTFLSEAESAIETAIRVREEELRSAARLRAG